MPSDPPSIDGQTASLGCFPLLEALRERRSRRFALGMNLPGGPLEYRSRYQPVPLTEREIATLVYAACGITGHALADLCHTPEGGGGIMGGFVARTIASGDGLQTVSLVVTNDEGTYLIRKPAELNAADISSLIDLGQKGEFLDLYRRSRVKLKDGRASIPCDPLFNINANRWSAHAPGTTCFLPINDLTFMYVNGLLEILNENTGAFILDERNHFRPAGLAGFARTQGGHLDSNPAGGRLVTVRQVEQFVTEFVTIEQGMMLQNLGLMAAALGLGGYPNFANHEFAWFQALGFRMAEMSASQYLGAGWLPSLMMKMMRRDPVIPYPVGLERDGEVILKPFCPPYYASMSEAVRAVVSAKEQATRSFHSRLNGGMLGQDGSTPGLGEPAVQATISYCEYLWQRYGRFPVYLPPYRTVLSFQACHLDVEFYEKFYQPEALSEAVRNEFRNYSQPK